MGGLESSGVPLLVVTGASGVGKSSAVTALSARARARTNCFFFDSIGVPSPEVIERDFGGGERWQADATKRWIARLSVEGSAGDVNVLDGQTRPSFIRAALESAPSVRSQIVLLDCDPAVRSARLAGRGHSDLDTPQMNTWAAYLRGQADALELPVIQTSELSVEEVASAIEELVEALRAG